MTIFRTIRYLETFGHSNTIWVYAPTLHETVEEAYQDIIQHFQLIKAQVKFTSDPGFRNAEGDVVFATDWGSVSYVNSVSNFKRRFYFVQDHEPEFYAQGTYAIAAKDTYKHDLDCICASPWLRQLMEQKYGKWARDFWLSVDFETYPLADFERDNGDVVKIAFYARHFTSRRAVELGFLALEALAERGLNIEVHCFGAPLPFDSAPFKCIDHGVCNTKQLAEIYQECDIGVVFSATNYSLIPQEMMACGIPVAELDVESTRAIFPEGVVTYLPTEPRLMADSLAQLVVDREKRINQAKIAYDWVSQFTWKDAAKATESAIFERLEELNFEKVESPLVENKVKASVIIPTWNAGAVFKKVIAQLEEQEAPWECEVLVVDSGSTDGTVEFVKSRPNIKLHEIPNSEFQHGRTRNLAISLTNGEYIAVLTQDALPVDEYWLYNMVTSLEHYPNAAGVFGKHYAWPDADPYTKRDLANHFEGFEAHPYCVSKHTNSVKWSSKDLGWKQFLHFYSDNNSMLRREVWEKIPYPEVKFGEDQAWALKIIEAGYQKVYSKQGAVYHSHDFDEGDVEKRAFEEAEFFRDEFGYIMVASSKVNETIEDLNKHDRQLGESQGLSTEMIERRLDSNRAKITGFAKANNND
jgi:GT2 family glycosyltransferase/glycosyltransferase involved in cell wall biosynthesis